MVFVLMVLIDGVSGGLVVIWGCFVMVVIFIVLSLMVVLVLGLEVWEYVLCGGDDWEL